MGFAANEVSVENGTAENQDLNHGLQRQLKVPFNSQPSVFVKLTDRIQPRHL